MIENIQTGTITLNHTSIRAAQRPPSIPMTPRSAREQLFQFLDGRVFQPTLTTQPPAYSSAEDRKLLKSVHKRVQDSRTRYVADYASAHEIKTNFLQDLGSKPGQALASDMWLLRLPRFEDVRADFLTLCTQLGI